LKKIRVFRHGRAKSEFLSRFDGHHAPHRGCRLAFVSSALEGANKDLRQARRRVGLTGFRDDHRGNDRIPFDHNAS